MNLKGILIGAAALLTASVANASTIEEIGNATYKLYEGGRAICSAVAVSPTQLVTAFHCVDGEKGNLNIQNWKLDDKFNPIAIEAKFLKVIRGFKGKDVAMLELKDGTLPGWVDVAKPEDVNLKLGDPLITIGYPMVMEITLTHGEFSALAPLTDMGMEGSFYKTTIPVTGGNSGGGLYQPKNGEYELIGLTTGGYSHVSFMNYFSNVNSLNELLKNMLTTPGAGTETKTPGAVNPADSR